jgi:hypothetical protein
MRVIELDAIGHEDKAWLKTPPKRKHLEACELIDEPTIIKVGGELVAYYDILPQEATKELRKAALTTKPDKSNRTSGIKTSSSVFGYMPRNAVRSDYCRITKKSKDEPANFDAVHSFAKWLTQYYKGIVDTHNEEAFLEQVGADWKMKDTFFTTANFNMNQVIKYHRDAFNAKGAWSNVLILSEGIRGGELVIPGLGVALKQQDNALAIFDGQKIMHGVHEVRQTKPGAYRCSCVFYTLQQLTSCYPYPEELQRAKDIYHEKGKRQFLTREERKALIGAGIKPGR